MATSTPKRRLRSRSAGAEEDGWLTAVAEKAAVASDAPVELLGEYLTMFADAAVSGRRPQREQLAAVRENGVGAGVERMLDDAVHAGDDVPAGAGEVEQCGSSGGGVGGSEGGGGVLKMAEELTGLRGGAAAGGGPRTVHAHGADRCLRGVPRGG